MQENVLSVPTQQEQRNFFLSNVLIVSLSFEKNYTLLILWAGCVSCIIRKLFLSLKSVFTGFHTFRSRLLSRSLQNDVHVNRMFIGKKSC